MASDVTNLPQANGQTRCSPVRFLARRRLLHDSVRPLGVSLKRGDGPESKHLAL